MAGASFNVSGMAELKVNLDKLSRGVGKRAMERAGMKAVAPTVEVIRSITPVDKTGGPDAGELRASIAAGTKAENSNIGAIAYERAKRAGATDAQAVRFKRDVLRETKGQRGDTYATVYIGPRAGRTRDQVIKGNVQEFGNARQEPQSYLRAGFEQDKPALFERLKTELRAELLKAVGKAEARAARRAAKAAGG